MVFQFNHLNSSLKRGFYTVLAFYLIGLGGTAELAQFMPVADMCNPGLPFITGFISLAAGIFLAAMSAVALLFGYRSGFNQGGLLAHLLVLGVVFLVGLVLATHG